MIFIRVALSLQVFGNTVIDVSLSQGVLAVSHSTKVVKLYSFEHILKKVLIKTITLFFKYGTILAVRTV